MPELVPGLYERLVTAQLSEVLSSVDAHLIEREGLDPADADEVLARHIAGLTRRALRSVGGGSDGERLARQIELTNVLACPTLYRGTRTRNENA